MYPGYIGMFFGVRFLAFVYGGGIGIGTSWCICVLKGRLNIDPDGGLVSSEPYTNEFVPHNVQDASHGTTTRKVWETRRPLMSPIQLHTIHFVIVIHLCWVSIGLRCLCWIFCLQMASVPNLFKNQANF